MIDSLAAMWAKGPTGTVGAWLLVLVALVTWWRYLPPVLDAWSNSVARERADRMREIERLEGQIKAADDRHAECMDGQRELRKEIDRLQRMISDMVFAMRRMQLASLSNGEIAPDIPPEFAALLLAIDEKTAKPD